MNTLDKCIRDLAAPDDEIDWFPILMEKAERAFNCSIEVSMRNICIKACDDKNLRGGKDGNLSKTTCSRMRRQKMCSL